jgi:renal tumor antigen
LVAEYRLISKKGEGTFSEVLKAQSTKTNKYVAIKCMKAHFYNIDQVTSHQFISKANTFLTR